MSGGWFVDRGVGDGPLVLVRDVDGCGATSQRRDHATYHQ